MTYSIDPDLQHLLIRQFPATKVAGSLLPLEGLSGYSAKVSLPDRPLLVRRAAGPSQMPGVNRQREYRILRGLHASGLVPQVFGRSRNWLLLEWLPGERLSEDGMDGALTTLAALVATLHRQPLTGYRLQLLPLLFAYWQRSHPARRHLNWLRTLKRLQQQGEPRPLRLAVLHMDIHCGNLLDDRGTLRLIDWEYAGDGDIALELAAIIEASALDREQQQRLLTAYAACRNVTAVALQQQIRRWQPWLVLLAASWYELRWQQTGEKKFATLAAAGWQRLSLMTWPAEAGPKR